MADYPGPNDRAAAADLIDPAITAWTSGLEAADAFQRLQDAGVAAAPCFTNQQLCEDPHLLAVVKPSGLLTQGRPGGEPTLEGLVRAYLAPDDPASIYLGTVHRLDRRRQGGSWR